MTNESAKWQVSKNRPPHWFVAIEENQKLYKSASDILKFKHAKNAVGNLIVIFQN